jgi:hypothetical protein
MDIDHDKAQAALEHLETEKARRLQAKIDAGEIVSVQTTVVVGAHDDNAEDAVDRHVASLPTLDPDGRPIHYDLLVIVTGVPRGEHLPGQWVSPQTTASSEGPALPSEKPAGSGVSPSPSQPTPTHVQVTVSNGSEEDPGQIAEGWYVIEDGLLVLRDRDDRLITSRALLKGENPATLAKILLRERAPNEFQGKIIYPKLGFA